MPSADDFGRFSTIFDDVPGDMHRASDMRHVENLTHPLDSVNPKLECGETSHRRPYNTVRGPELADVLNSRNAMSASQCISQVQKIGVIWGAGRHIGRYYVYWWLVFTIRN